MTQATQQDPTLVQGTLKEKHEDRIVIAVPRTNYQLHLAIEAPVNAEIGRSVKGRIHAVARRVDVVDAGGRFVEPVFGRPRRVQGFVAATDATANALTVYCGVPMICKLTAPGQMATQFNKGELVSFDVERGALFRPVAG